MKRALVITMMAVLSAASIFGQTSQEDFSAYVREAEKFLYDPNSFYRDEDAFEPIARKASTYEGFTEVERARYAHIADLCALNAKGTLAANFWFCGMDGVERTLYSVKSEYTLLFFSNPGCHACGEIIQKLSSGTIGKMINEGRLAVVNIYIDEDLAAWKAHVKDYPSTWITGFDPYGVLREDTIYNIRAIPSLYLLDEDKEVILKDAPIERILYCF